MCLVIYKHGDHHETPIPQRATAVLVRRSRNSNPVDLYPSVCEQSNRHSKVRVPIDIYPDLKLESWAVTQVLSTEKVLSRPLYVAESVLYRFDVEQWGL